MTRRRNPPIRVQDKDAAKAERVMQAMLQMKKIDIRQLKQDAEGRR
jgi:hypothetical protein